MSRFVSPHDRLDSRELPDGRVQLLAPLWYQSDLLGGRIVKVREGFVNDRESVPWYLPLLYVWLAVKRKASRAGTIHDWLTQTQKVGDAALGCLDVPRWLTDAVYHEAAALDGNGRFTRWVKWAGVRIGGASAYTSGPARFQINGNDRRKKPRIPLTPEDRRRLEALARQSAAERGPTTNSSPMTYKSGRSPQPPPEAP